MADGTVVIKVETNARTVAQEFARLDRSLDKSEKSAKGLDTASSQLSKTFWIAFPHPALVLAGLQCARTASADPASGSLSPLATKPVVVLASHWKALLSL